MNTWVDTGTGWVNLATGETAPGAPPGQGNYTDTYPDTY